jgi:hypothetical protein
VTTCGSVSAAPEGDGYQLWDFVKVTIYGIGDLGFDNKVSNFGAQPCVVRALQLAMFRTVFPVKGKQDHCA